MLQWVSHLGASWAFILDSSDDALSLPLNPDFVATVSSVGEGVRIEGYGVLGVGIPFACTYEKKDEKKR